MMVASQWAQSSAMVPPKMAFPPRVVAQGERNGPAQVGTALASERGGSQRAHRAAVRDERLHVSIYDKLAVN